MADIHDLEKDELQARTNTTIKSLYDLRKLYYTAQTVGSLLTQNDLIRNYLQGQTGLTTRSLYDLWRVYLVSQGVTLRTSLIDMLRDFYVGNDLDPNPVLSTGAGQPYGLLLTLTKA